MQRTKAALRSDGYIVGVCEKWIQYSPKDPRRKIRPGERQDLFGWIDVIAIRPDEILAVQVCGADVAAHIRKIEGERGDNFMVWIAAGGFAQIWGWRKVKKIRGGKAMIWRPRILEFSKTKNEWDEMPK